MRPLLSALFFFAAISTPLAALAGDYAYNFSIPVSVGNLPPGARLQGGCTLFAGANATGAALVTTYEPLTIPVNNGGYSGSIAVSTASATKPGSYACYVFVLSASSVVNFTAGNYQKPVAGWTGPMVAIGNL